MMARLDTDRPLVDMCKQAMADGVPASVIVATLETYARYWADYHSGREAKA